MIKPEKTINGTKWIETIQINAEERATLEDQYGIDEDIIEYVTDNDESTNYVYDINEDDQLFIFLAPYALDKDALRLPSHLACCSIRAFYSRLIKATYLKSTRHFTRHWIIPRLRASMHLFWKHCLQLLTALSQFLAPLPRNATIWIKC